jgi:hypothetical protein
LILARRNWRSLGLIVLFAGSKKEKPTLSSEETLRVLQEIPNEHRLIFVLDVVIAVRAVSYLGCAG